MAAEPKYITGLDPFYAESLRPITGERRRTFVTNGFLTVVEQACINIDSLNQELKLRIEALEKQYGIGFIGNKNTPLTFSIDLDKFDDGGGDI